MPNDDGRRSRSGREEDGKPGPIGETRREPAPGKQSLVDQEFGTVGSGTVVQRRGGSNPGSTAPMGPGKQSLVEATFGGSLGPGAIVQRHGASQSLVDATFGILSPVQTHAGASGPPGAVNEAGVHAVAAQGIATPSSRLPHIDAIQRSFGSHDISSVQAHTGAEAAASARAMNADAYATGNHIVLGGRSDLHTTAHEAAHIVQQRSGVHLKGGVGAAGDEYERHADAVADRVVAGESAAPLLDQMAGGGHSSAAVQRAPAMPASPDNADLPQDDPAAFTRLQGLLTRAGLSVAQQQLPTANLLAADAARISNLLLQAQPSLVGLCPRMVAARLMQDVVSGGGHTSIAAVVQRLAAFDCIIMLRPDGYIAHAVTGEAIQRAGKTEFVNGELHAGGLVAGTFYYSSGGVFYRASASLVPMGPPIGELGLERDAVSSALDGTADALVGVAAGLYQLIRHPIDSISALRQLPGAIAQLIENSPEYWELFRAKPLNDQIHDVSKLVTTLATMYGGAAGATTRLAAAAGDLGDLTIQVLKLSARGDLALATVSVPVGTVATALSSGPGAVYVLHMANSSLNNSGGGGGEKDGPHDSTKPAPAERNGGPQLTPGKNFKEHYISKKPLLEKALGAKFGKLKEGGGEAFLKAVSDGINSGDFKYVGQGTLKKGMEAMNIYRGQGLTIVTKASGEWVTLLESGEGLDLAIQMIP